MRQFLIDISGRTTPADDQRIAMGLKENLGLQNVRIEGIRHDAFRASHPRGGLPHEVDRDRLGEAARPDSQLRLEGQPRSVARNALQRWYFTPDYDCVRVSEDQQAMALEGEGVKLMSEDEFVQANGMRAAPAPWTAPATSL